MRATAYKHNKQVFLPEPQSADDETNHEFRKAEMRRIFSRAVDSRVGSKDSNSIESNLSKDELEGLKSLKKRIAEGSLVIACTDKTKRYAALTPDQYIQSGLVHTKDDIEIQATDVKKIQKCVNHHVHWLKEIFNCGVNWGHTDRMNKNLIDKGEQACHMTLLVKDHKKWSVGSDKPVPSRPVVSGNTGLNCHLSEIISHLIDPIALEQSGNEIDSSDDMLARIQSINEKLMNQPNVESVDIDEIVVEDEQYEHVASTHIETETRPGKIRFDKSDIRSYGLLGEKTLDNDDLSNRDRLKERIQILKNSRMKDSVLPNLSDRMKAGLLMDTLEEGEIICLPGKKHLINGKKNKQRNSGLAIVGSDVVSLFPSMRNVETARLARHAVLNSSVKYENY